MASNSQSSFYLLYAGITGMSHPTWQETFLFCFAELGFERRGLALARQVLYQLSCVTVQETQFFISKS
jgi:hypothetical protein